MSSACASLSSRCAAPLRRLSPSLLSPRARSLSSSADGPIGAASRPFLELEDRFGSHNYHPIPVVLSRGLGVHVWDVDGCQYLDCLSAYSAVNQGHCHPRLVAAMARQASRLTLSSRAFCSDQLGPYAKQLTTLMGYDRVLPMNTGAEGTETALKLARRWGYDVKGVPANRATVLVASGAFHGRTIAAISASDDPESYGGFGPLMPGLTKVPFGDLGALRRALAADPTIVAFMVEPVQGEAGVVVPPAGYLAGAAAACRAAGALFIADEVQTGLCRTGRMLATQWEGACVCARGSGESSGCVCARPDILVLGKALSGGMLPVSAVLADDAVMLCIRPGQHGSTFGGNPLACAVASEALAVLTDEGLAANADARGEQLRAGLRALARDFPTLLSPAVRGRGLLCAVEVRADAADAAGAPISAWDLCIGLKDARAVHGAPLGLLAKPTHGTIIRLAPPLVITQEQVQLALEVMRTVCDRLLQGKGRAA